MLKNRILRLLSPAMLCLVAAIARAEEPAPVDTVVVCPRDFQQTLAPWLKHRESQGHVIKLVSNLGSADEIRQQIKSTAENGKLRFVVLVGDAPSSDEDRARSRCTPTFRLPAKVNVAWGG